MCCLPSGSVCGLVRQPACQGILFRAARSNRALRQDTYREWLDSPYPARGRTCQGCHMPDRAHRFRGIHDPDMVRQGLTINTRVTEEAALLEVRSTGIGHRFPTYIVPRVRLIGLLLDSDGRPIPGGAREEILQRQMSIENGRWIEQSDTRLEPGATASLRLLWQVGGRCGNKIRFRIVVDPGMVLS